MIVALQTNFFFPKWGSPSLCIKEMHTICFYFIYSTKTCQRPYNDHTNRSQKKRCQSTTKLVQNARGSDKALCLIHHHRRLPGTIQRNRLVCKPKRSSPPLFASPSRSVRQRRSLSPGLPSTPPRRQTVPPPYTSPSWHVRRQDPAAPCRRDETLSMC
jgi:hypothetical protein